MRQLKGRLSERLSGCLCGVFSMRLEILASSPGHPTRQKTGASQKMDRSKKGPPEVPHGEGALGDLWGTDF